VAPLRSAGPDAARIAFAPAAPGGRQPTWTAELAERVRHLRGQYPRWGKDKLVVLLGREGRRVSTSMVGRILTRLKQRGVLVEPPSRRVAAARRLRHRLWAVRKPRHWRVCEPGDLVQVDTLDLRPVPGVLLKQFTARDVISRWDVLEARSRCVLLRETAPGIVMQMFKN